MSGLDGTKGHLRLAAALPAVLLLTGSAVAETDPPAVLRERLASNVRLSDPSRAEAVRKAVLGAFDSLGKAKCQGVFADFRDASGGTLQEKLDTLGETGQSYLSLVFFYEGSALRGCRSPKGLDISAMTIPGSRVVYICRSNFSEVRHPRPFYREAVIIHETLHSLGLGENPPTSKEITWRVFSRCAG